VAEDVQLQVERPNIFVLYEQNIGLLTPIIADDLREAEKLYAADWIADAFREAVAQNKRTWRYVQRVLERWAKEGRGTGAPGRPPTAPAGERRGRKREYVPEGYEDLVEH
jgi:DnaD/phage-associated family protein